MARKSGHTTRPKKNKPANQGRLPIGAPTEVTEAPASDGGSPELVAETVVGNAPLATPNAATAPRATSSRKTRPYQQRKTSPTARISPAASITITKEQEYAFIREDLRRLLLTAGVLTVIMIGLLFAIDR